MLLPLEEKKKDTKKEDERLKMWCECCEKQFDRWDMDMVEPEPIAFEINEIMKELGSELVEFNFACPECVTELVLVPVQTEMARKFRRINEELRMVLAPAPIN